MLPDDGNLFRGGGSGVGVGTGAPTTPSSETPNQSSRPSEDSWPEQFDDHGNAVDPGAGSTSSNGQSKSRSQVADADKEIYSDKSFSERVKREAVERAKAKAGAKISQTAQKLLGDKVDLNQDHWTARERAKEIARKKAREAAKKQIGKRIANEGVKKGFEKGLEKGASTVVKEGAKKAAQQAGKAAGKAAAKVGTQTAAKVGVQAGTAAVEGAIDVAGAATGAATFGVGFILALLINIAISLGINDAVEALFELGSASNSAAHGNSKEALAHEKQALFLAIRAGAKVGMFIVLLLGFALTFSVVGLIVGIPFLIFINVYMLLGFAFRWIPQLQGLVWWEIMIILIVDFFAIIIALTFLAAMGWWICDQSGLGGGALVDTAAKVVDWWTSSTYTSSVNEMCSSIKNLGGTATTN